MKRSETIFSIVAVPWDGLMIIAAGLLAYAIRFRWSDFIGLTESYVVYPFEAYTVRLVLAAMLTLVFFAASGLYRMHGTRKFMEDIPRIVLAVSTTMLVAIVILFFQRQIFLSRFLILSTWILGNVFLVFGRVALVLLQRALFQYGVGLHRVVLVGNGSIGERLAQEIRESTHLGYALVGQVAVATRQSLDDIVRWYRNGRLDEIIITNADLDRENLHAIGDAADEHHIPLRYAIDLFPNHRANLAFTTLGSTPLVEISRTRLEGWGRVVKRLFDIVVSALLIVLFLPVMVAAAIAIAIDSGLPILFRMLPDGRRVERIGARGKAFPYFKFRTMSPDAHALRYSKELLHRNLRSDGPMVKYMNDPRVTRVGRFIRRYSIDELPELLLVFAGHMSLVGPRPHFPEEVERFQKHHNIVMEIKPGVTGLAQVNGRSDLTFEEEVRLDRHYIEHWSFLLDLWILLKTPWAVLKGTKDV